MPFGWQTARRHWHSQTSFNSVNQPLFFSAADKMDSGLWKRHNCWQGHHFLFRVGKFTSYSSRFVCADSCTLERHVRSAYTYRVWWNQEECLTLWFEARSCEPMTSRLSLLFVIGSRAHAWLPSSNEDFTAICSVTSLEMKWTILVRF